MLGVASGLPGPRQSHTSPRHGCERCLSPAGRLASWRRRVWWLAVGLGAFARWLFQGLKGRKVTPQHHAGSRDQAESLHSANPLHSSITLSGFTSSALTLASAAPPGFTALSVPHPPRVTN